MNKQVRLKEDYEGDLRGTNMHVESEDDFFYHGVVSSRCGTYITKFPVDLCEIKEKPISKQEKWDKRFFELTKHVASWSEDQSTQVGCVIVGENNEIRTTGYNGFPRGVIDKQERHQRPEKYMWFEHAERNAIYNAARMGTALDGTTAYLQWFPCTDCARALIQSGIKRVVCVEPDWNIERFNFKTSRQIFSEADVEITFLETN